jgi:hypothetical protein
VAEKVAWSSVISREQILKDLYKIITKSDGGVAIIIDSGPRDGLTLPWKEIIDQTVRRWLGEERKAGTKGTYSHPTKRFETILQESEFRDLEFADFKLERSWSIDQIIGYLYSTSSSSLPVLGRQGRTVQSRYKSKVRGNSILLSNLRSRWK